MASTQAMCTSFKAELLSGIHALGTTVTRAGTTADALKVALFLDAATLGAATTAYSSTSECTASGTYAAGGSAVTFVAPTYSGTTAYAGPTSASTLSWTTFTATGFSAALLYNSTQGNKAIAVYTFSSQSITAGTFTITFPTNAAGTALINLT